MKKLLLALALLLAPATASAQCNGIFPNNTICGNATGASNTARPTPNNVLTGVPGGTNGQVQYNNAGNFGGFTAIGDCSITGATGVVSCSAATVAVIQALDATKYTNVYLTDLGRAGYFHWTLGDFTTAVAADTNKGVYIKTTAISAGVGVFVRQGVTVDYQLPWFGATAGATDWTITLNSALATMRQQAFSSATTVANLIVPRGIKFSSTGIVNPAPATNVHFNLKYFVDSDITQPAHIASSGTSEEVELSVNSGYSLDPTGGMVAEKRYSAILHPSILIDLRKDLSFADPNFNCSIAMVDGQCNGTGQTRIPTANISAKGSLYVMDEELARFNFSTQSFASNTSINATQMNAWASSVALANVGSIGWPTVPVAGTVITGVTSKAIGIKKAVQSSSTTVLDVYWVSGQPIVGEKVTDGVTTSTNNISAVTFTNTTNTPLWFGTNNPAISVDVGPGDSQTAFTVGGRETVTKSRGFGQNIMETVTDPARMWCEGVAAPTACIQIRYSTVPSASSRRLEVVKGNSQATVPNAWMSGPTLAVRFSDAASPAANANAYGVTSIARASTGVYRITLNHTLAQGDLICQLTRTNFADLLEMSTVTTTTIDIINRDSGGTPANAAGSINATCFGGDVP